MAVVWREVGYTEYNDPPPGAGNLAWGGYSFAELGTATRQGVATGFGNLAFLFSYPGEVPMGTLFTFYANGRVVYARKEDRGYGQGGNGTHSDRAYAVDMYNGSAHGLPSLSAALGVGGKGAVWAMWGEWRKGDALPRGAAKVPQIVGSPGGAAGGAGAFIAQKKDPPEHHRKVQSSGGSLSQHGARQLEWARWMASLRKRRIYTPTVEGGKRTHV